jgi:hypothetical protein
LRIALEPALGERARCPLFVPAVLLASGADGLGPGLLATVLNLILAATPLANFPYLFGPEAVSAATVAAIAAGIAWAGDLLQRSRLRATKSAVALP